MGYLRTRSRDITSERTTKSVMSNLIIRNFLKVAPTGTMQLIRKYIVKGKIELINTRALDHIKIGVLIAIIESY